MLVAHLDFKGVLPRAEHLPCLLEDVSALGFDGVLVEYEDVFPFDGVQLSAAPEEIWSRSTLQSFLDKAADLNLEVIPFQQCLGHLEWVFRWEQWQHFALDLNYPSTLDIFNADAKKFVFGLFEQVLDAHPSSRFVHVGLDEAHALVSHARENGLNAVELLLDILEEICALCQSRNVTPLIFTDMFENNWNTASLQRLKTFREHVIMTPWDYAARGERTATARIGGARTTRAWLQQPQNGAAPLLDESTKWIEEMDEAARKIIAPHFDGETFAPLFWCDVWVQLGFRVMGISASRASAQGAVLPNYNSMSANISAWQQALNSNNAMGHIVSSWARGTSWCPPNFPFDLTWPLLQVAAREAGKNPPPFFEGVDESDVARIFASLGRCRADWKIESQLADEMDALETQLSTHSWEWRATSLMARVLAWKRRAAAVQDEVDYFWANARPVPGEWQRRINEQDDAIGAGGVLRESVAAHFGERYAGDAFEEWLRDLFDAPISRLRDCGAASQAKMKSATEKYGRVVQSH